MASLPHKCQPPLPSSRQHPNYGDCLDDKREFYQNCSVLGCVTQCLQSAAHSYEQFLQVQQIGFVILGCLELSYCNMVEWSWWDSSLIWKTSWFPPVLWHCWFGHMTCKIVPEMTYNVSSGTLSLCTTTTQIQIPIDYIWIFCESSHSSTHRDLSLYSE